MTRIDDPTPRAATQPAISIRDLAVRVLPWVVASIVVLAACTTAPPPKPTPPAATSTAQEGRANLASASGSLVSGTVTLKPMGDGVHLTGTVGGFAANSHHGKGPFTRCIPCEFYPVLRILGILYFKGKLLMI